MAFIKISLVLVSLISLSLATQPHFKCGENGGMLPWDRAEREAEESSPPFRIFISKTTVRPGENISVRVFGDVPFNAYSIQGHYVYDEPVGIWLPSTEQEGVQECHHVGDTLVNGDMANVNEAVATWITPAAFSAGANEVEFSATVMLPGGRFWTDIHSVLVTIIHTPVEEPLLPVAPGPVVIDEPEEEEGEDEDEDEEAPPPPHDIHDPRDEAENPPPSTLGEEEEPGLSAEEVEQQEEEGPKEDPNEGERLAKEHHDRAAELDRVGPPPEEEVPAYEGDDNPEVLHDRLQEDEMEARWKEQKHMMVVEEEANSEGNWPKEELRDQEEHEKEIHDEMMQYELEKEREQKVRQERIRAEIRDKEEYDLLKVRKEEQLKREQQEAREREREEIDIVRMEDNDNNVVRAEERKTSGSDRLVSTMAAILVTVGIMML